MRLSRSQIALLIPLLVALFLAGDALAQRFGNNYYAQQQMQRQQQMQQQQMQMQRQQEQMRRQQEQARQQQAAMRRQQAEQQRIMQQRRNESIQQRQMAMERQRKAAEQRKEAQSKKIAQGSIFSNRQTANQSLLTYRTLEKNRKNRLLQLKQDFFQTQKAENKKANSPASVKPFSLTEIFNTASGGRRLSAYQPNKAHTTKELTAQRQTAKLSTIKLKATLTDLSLSKPATSKARPSLRSNKVRSLESLKALPAPRQIEAAWGASKYRKGGLMTGIEHIFYRHGPNSGFTNVSKFSQGITPRRISNYVDKALRYGKITTDGPDRYVVDYDTKRTIGTSLSGAPTSNIRIYVNQGIIQTVFPY